jgi:hypothetical protein
MRRVCWLRVDEDGMLVKVDEEGYVGGGCGGSA